MPSKRVLCGCVLGILFTAAFGRDRPRILSPTETILEANADFNVTCEGTKPLNWTVPPIETESQKNYSKWTVFSVEDVAPAGGRGGYASRLSIQNVSFPFAGFYACAYLDAAEAASALIYLFVRDEEHLSVNEEQVVTVTVTQYTDAVLPCRPTSPDVSVKLTLLTGEKIESAIYDPKTGFRFYVDDYSYQETYSCLFTYRDTEFETYVVLKFDSMIDRIATPALEEISGRHTVVGEALVLECKVRHPLPSILFEWRTPTGAPDLKRMALSPMTRLQDDSLISQQLVVNRTTLADRGRYTCAVFDSQNHHSETSIAVVVYDVDENFINLSEENGMYLITAMAGADAVQWRIDVDAHPQVRLTWLDNRNEPVPAGAGPHYTANVTASEAFLQIRAVTIEDYGNYTLVAENAYRRETLALFLNVTDKPSVHIASNHFHLLNTPSRVVCIAAANPEPTIRWQFKPCLDAGCAYAPLQEEQSKRSGLQLTSTVQIKAVQSGFVRCTANNSLGSDAAVQGFYVSDVEDGLDIFGLSASIDINREHNQAIVAEGDSVTMTCGASVHNYTGELQWSYNGTQLTNDDKYNIERSRTEFTNRITLTIPQMGFDDQGLYQCRVPRRGGDGVVYENMTIDVMAPTLPIVNSTNLKGSVEMDLPQPLQLFCYTWGIPKPTLTWFKNGEEFHPNNHTRIMSHNQKIVFVYTDVKDEGTYKCEAANRVGRVEHRVNVIFKNKPDNRRLIAVIIILILIVVGFFVVIVCKIRKEHKLERELRKIGLANFEKGGLENLNPDLGVDDQAELLPYDNKKWEFPVEKLKLGKQLGSGAFGVVMKGVARGIVDGDEATVVAVKMVKHNADFTYIKALVSELKIMVHLGQHLNVVNLLGACTKNLVKRELLVIVEYCRYGNLHNYLMRHRGNFINQIDPKTGRVDYTIGSDVLERTYSISSNRSNTGGTGAVPLEMADYRGGTYAANAPNTHTAPVSMSPSPSPTGQDNEGMVLSNNSIQPEWRSNYKGDYKGSVRPICTKDLLTWAFQVARGMEYLVSRKVLHGDLAARNILLTDNNVVKICDFGLAKSMYKNDNYKKKGGGLLPVKWMAIESIRDRVFSTQSDVWAYGIVLWEFFSLAGTPYPGMAADEKFYNKLVEGYRMEAPEFCPRSAYALMRQCWQEQPLDRPTFAGISDRIGAMLEESVRRHYIDLNDPYLVMNTQRLEEGQSDYLAMFTPPNFENLSSPHNYANDLPPGAGAAPGYLCMQPTNIFSPRADDDTMFDFGTTPRKDRLLGSEALGNELLPMLNALSESDGESACNSPSSFANPSYHISPAVLQRDKNEFLKTLDNYVNMPNYKNVISVKDKNPFVKIDEDTKDVHYVNGNTRNWEGITV